MKQTKYPQQQQTKKQPTNQKSKNHHTNTRTAHQFKSGHCSVLKKEIRNRNTFTDSRTVLAHTQ